MKRQTGEYERSTVVGEDVRAFIPYPLPPADPPLGLEGELARLFARATGGRGPQRRRRCACSRRQTYCMRSTTPERTARWCSRRTWFTSARERKRGREGPERRARRPGGETVHVALHRATPARVGVEPGLQHVGRGGRFRQRGALICGRRYVVRRGGGLLRSLGRGRRRFECALPASIAYSMASVPSHG